MKKAAIFLIIVFVNIHSFGQQTNAGSTLTRQDYLKKSKDQKTAAWIFLGAGAALITIAAPGNVSFDLLPVLVIGGGVAVVVSIPLFIASARNKRKVNASTSFQLQKVPIAGKSGFAYHLSPTISVKLHF